MPDNSINQSATLGPATNLAAALSDSLGNPNVQAYLHMLSSAEGTAQSPDPYSTGFGGTQLASLDEHPGTEHSFTQTNGKQNTTSAAGAYQFEKGTWNDIQKTLSLPDFGPRSQDMGAVYLMNQNGSLQDAMNGDFQSAVQKDGKTWASLPSSTAPQNKRSWDFVNQALGQSSGASQGSSQDGGNSAPPASTDAPGGAPSAIPNATPDQFVAAYQRAQAAQDTQAMQQIQQAFAPKAQQALQGAQQANDTEAVGQIQTMMGQMGLGQPQGQSQPQAPGSPPQQPAAQQQPTPAPQAAQAPQTAAPASGAQAPQQPSMLDNVLSFGKQAVMHPFDTGAALANSAAQGAVNLGKQYINDPMGTMDGLVRGAADGLTFGTADKLAALAASQATGTSYADELSKQRQQDQAGGTAFTAGQLVSPFVPGAGAMSLVGNATKLVPTASTAVRMLAGAGAGAAEGAANYLGHNDGPVDVGNLATNAVLGGAMGPLGALGGPTTAQRSATFLRQFGGEGVTSAERLANAQRSADVIQGLQGLQARATQGDAALGPADANALAMSYTQNAGDALRQMGSTPEQQTLLNALQRPRALNDDDLDAIRQLPNGGPVADAIQASQQVRAMTAPTPANTGTIASGLRMAVDNGALGVIGHAITPGLGFVLDSSPVRKLAMGALGGRENRTGNIAALVDQAPNAQAFLTQNGPSQAAQSAQALAQAAQSSQAARQAAAQAAVMSNANAYANGYLNRGLAAAQQARTVLGQGPAQRVAQAQAVQQALQAQQARNALTAATRMPLGGGYQTLLQGGASGLGLTSTDANQGLRALSNHPVLGPIADQMRQTGGVADPTQFYALQNGLRGLKEQGYIGQAAAQVPQATQVTAAPALSAAIRNPASYAATVSRNQQMVDSAVANAPTPQMAVVAQQMGAQSSPEIKQQAFDAVMSKASANEQQYLKTHVQPLIRYGK